MEEKNSDPYQAFTEHPLFDTNLVANIESYYGMLDYYKRAYEKIIGLVLTKNKIPYYPQPDLNIEHFWFQFIIVMDVPDHPVGFIDPEIFIAPMDLPDDMNSVLAMIDSSPIMNKLIHDFRDFLSDAFGQPAKVVIAYRCSVYKLKDGKPFFKGNVPQAEIKDVIGMSKLLQSNPSMKAFLPTMNMNARKCGRQGCRRRIKKGRTCWQHKRGKK